jgi:hypothetical protein
VARRAGAFYLLTFLFLAILLVQLAFLVLYGGEALESGDVVGPLVNLLLALTFYSLALDGRRSYKALKAARGKAGEPAGLTPYG